MPSTFRIPQTWLWTPVLLIVLAAASYGVYLALQPPKLPPGLIYGSGRIEGTETRLGSEIAGRVAWSGLTEGVAVKAGTPLVRIDATDLDTVLGRTGKEKAAAIRDLARLDAELATARHHRDTAANDAQRYRDLEKRGTATSQRREQADNALAEADGRLKALEASRAALAARRDAVQQSEILSRSQVEKAELRAPLDATILLKLVEPGEVVAAGQPLAVLVNLAALELKLYVPEADIGRIKLGASARVRVDALPARYFPAKVARIDAEAQFTPRDVHMPDERARLVFGVTLSLSNPDGLLKPGMPADAWIQTLNSAWPERLVVPK